VAGSSLGGGCAFVPEKKYEDSRLQIQALRAENEQLRDVVLNVRSQNRDLSLRAVEDARRLRAQEAAIRRLERSVQAYQEDRDAMIALLDQINAELRGARSTAQSKTEQPTR
jgi:uncharacterized transporter YbjL